MADHVKTKMNHQTASAIATSIGAKHGKRRGYARRMKKEPTPAELRLWLSIRPSSGFPHYIQRQVVFGKFIVDFYCASARLVIEADGSFHDGREEYDERRTRFLNGCGLKVIRFTNSEIMRETREVVEDIAKHCEIGRMQPMCAIQNIIKRDTTPKQHQWSML
jgi:very-short-patch-repair endonuclease